MALDVVQKIHQVEVQLVTNKHVAPKHHLKTVGLGDLGEVVVSNVEAEHINVLESVLDIHHIIVRLAHLIQRQIQEAVIQEDVVLQQQVVVVHHV